MLAAATTGSRADKEAEVSLCDVHGQLLSEYGHWCHFGSVCVCVCMWGAFSVQSKSHVWEIKVQMLFVPCLPQTVLLYSCQDIESFLWLLCRRPGKKKKEKKNPIKSQHLRFCPVPHLSDHRVAVSRLQPATLHWEVEQLVPQHSSFCDESDLSSPWPGEGNVFFGNDRRCCPGPRESNSALSVHWVQHTLSVVSYRSQRPAKARRTDRQL